MQFSYFFTFTFITYYKVPDRERVKKVVLGILQSTAFLSYNAFGFVWGHCFVRALLQFSNFWTVALLPGWLASFLRS